MTIYEINFVTYDRQQHYITTYSFWVTDGRLQQHPVALQEVLEGVANWESQLPDADGVQHAGVSQLTHTQLSVKRLKGEHIKAYVNIISMWV